MVGEYVKVIRLVAECSKLIVVAEYRRSLYPSSSGHTKNGIKARPRLIGSLECSLGITNIYVFICYSRPCRHRPTTRCKASTTQILSSCIDDPCILTLQQTLPRGLPHGADDFLSGALRLARIMVLHARVIQCSRPSFHAVELEMLQKTMSE